MNSSLSATAREEKVSHVVSHLAFSDHDYDNDPWNDSMDWYDETYYVGKSKGKGKDKKGKAKAKRSWQWGQGKGSW